MDIKIKDKITEVIGENIDKLISIDWRGSGFVQPLYQSLREKTKGSLAMTAAKKCVETIRENDTVFILTGFPVGPFDVLKEGKVLKQHEFSDDLLAPETDGVVAAALLARAMDLGFKAKPVIFCEDECVNIVKACCIAAGLRVQEDFEKSKILNHSVTIQGFTKDINRAKEDAHIILTQMNPVAAISIERPGRNEKGAYHMANGRAITKFVAKIDELFEGVAQRGKLTIGIGDLGNELGMGALKETTKKTVFYGEKCRCGCGGGIGASFEADATIFGAISEDAAYALLACMAYLLQKSELLQTTNMEERVLEASCANGAIDGPSGLSVPWIDYLDVKIHNCQIELMREIITSPQRFYELQPFFYGDLILK